MTGAGKVYGEALYDLAREECLTAPIRQQLEALEESFSQEPEYLRLLSAPNLSKEERCALLEEAFRGRIEPYLLNFLKILTEKGYILQFRQCCDSYFSRFDREHGILRVTACTAVAMTGPQQEKLTGKLQEITGKTVVLKNRVQPDVLGGVRLDYDGKRVDDTVAHRLSSIQSLLSKTVI